MTDRLALFAYGSLVNRESVRETLGPGVAAPLPALLANHRRRWSLVRDNRRSEKGFAPLRGANFDWCLGLNLEPAAGNPREEWPNGALVAVDAGQLERLDRRELRYRRAEVTPDVRTEEPHPFGAVFAFVARDECFAATPPPRSVVIATYLAAVEDAFATLGPGELERLRATTEPPPAPVVDARLVRDAVPRGNPRAW